MSGGMWNPEIVGYCSTGALDLLFEIVFVIAQHTRLAGGPLSSRDLPVSVSLTLDCKDTPPHLAVFM